MAQETIVVGFKVPRIEDASPLVPEPPYTYENGTPYVPPPAKDKPFIPDNGLDGPA